ncbi:DUF7108 family protein [Saliphagus infecundisoli]|uniref:RnhA operon protein n=1 Tax=Saliphagus infecundisoli TaxID=1849069 RepID=A0ABD5QBX0_9EURY|nr:rnhA operon protein [Saliphagus infecundisoli]
MSDLDPEPVPGSGPDDGSEGSDSDSHDGEELPESAVEEAERLTRLARAATDDDERAAYRGHREELLEDHEFTARVREEDTGDVLVVHPAEWHDEAEGVIRTDRIEDLSRAREVRLEGAGSPDDWEDVESENRALVADVREIHGDVHADNAAALADFMGNHYARPMTEATAAELSEFRSEYFVRNAWPTDDQRAVLAESIRLVFETADEPLPDY